MVNTSPDRDSLESLHAQLNFDLINIDTDIFIKREVQYGYDQDQFFFDIMEIEDTFYEQFSFRISEKKNNSQLSFYPNYIVYIYNRQHGLENDTNESEQETSSGYMEENFEEMEL